MADFVGSTGNDTLVGTNGADTFINNGGRDFIDGAGGNDAITLNAPLDFGSTVAGGGGTDLLILEEFAQPAFGAGSLFPDGTFTSTTLLLTTSLSSIEAVEYHSVAGNQLSIVLELGGNNPGFPYPQQVGTDGLSETATLTGGAGTDFLVLIGQYLVEETPVVTLNAPTFNLVNWETPERAYQVGDRVVVLGSMSANYVINGSAHSGVQQLGGGTGNDTFNGSDDMDYIQTSGGTDQLFGNGGDDSLALINLVQINPNGEFYSFLTGEGSLFDGGDGTDFLVLGGNVTFGGTVQNIEGIYLSRSFDNLLAPGVAGTSRQDITEVEMDGDTFFDMFPADLILDGEGTLIFSITDPGTFDASGFTFTPGSSVTILFDIDDENVNLDHVVIGTSNSDIFEGGDGNDTFTGGGGADLFKLSLGNDVMTDFTIGEDKFDLEALGLTSLAQARTFFSQIGNDAVFSFTFGGQLNSVTLLNVDSSVLSAQDFVFADPFAPRFVDGTDGADFIIGLRGNDTLLGAGGNDTILSGGGLDFIEAGDGDDRIVLNGFVIPPLPQMPGSVFAGGNGVDTLVVTSLPDAPISKSILSPQGIPATGYSLLSAAVTSIERIEFDTEQGTAANVALGFGGVISLQIGNGGVSATAQVVGSDGYDQISLFAFHPSGPNDYFLTIPEFDLVNWETPDRAYRLEADRIVFFQAGNGNGTVAASAHDGVVNLLGGSGNDTLIGSDGMEMLNGGGGVNALFGEEGDDLVMIGNTITVARSQFGGPTTETTTTFTGAGSIFDGGGGFDFLGIGGVVFFQGIVSNVEGLWLAPSYTNVLAPDVTGQAVSQAPTELHITSAVLAQLPQDLLIDGIGEIFVEVVPGGSFDGSLYTFDANAVVAITVDGSFGNDMIIGTTGDDVLSGRAGGDTLVGGLGNDTINGEDGNDIAIFTGARAAYQVSAVPSGAVFVNGPDGNDLFLDIETFRFADGDLVWNPATGTLVPGISGVVADGHIAGATVYVDVNENGQLDVGEPSTVTNPDGTYVLATELTGTIRATGGTDVSTGEANLLTLSAPVGSTVINPLTTLVQTLVEQGSSIPEAEVQVKAAFGLDAALDLFTTDPIDAANFNAAALDAQKAATATAEVASRIAENGGDASASIAALASAIQSSGGGQVSLTDNQTLTAVISAGLPGASPETIETLVQQSQTVVTYINNATDLSEIAEAQVNEAPEFVSMEFGVTTLNGTAIIFSADVTDPDGDTLSFSASAAANGTVAAGANGSFTYTPDAAFTGADSFIITASDGLGGTATQLVTITVSNLPAANQFVMFTANGFTGGAGGSGAINGTDGFQQIAVIDVPGAIALDPSFNKGGDVLQLSGDASAWFVTRSGSSALFSDGDTFVTVPVGTAGLAVQFGDGVRELVFNGSSFAIGGQTFGIGTLAQITAAPDGTSLPDGADPSAKAVLFIAADAGIAASGVVDIFGAAGDELARLVSGNLTLDASFNKGGDTIAFDEAASDYFASQVGSSLRLTGSDTTALIPVGTNGATLAFGDGSDTRPLLLDTTIPAITIGGQQIGLDPVQLMAV